MKMQLQKRSLMLRTWFTDRLVLDCWKSMGQIKSTRDRRPLTMIYYEACLRQDDAAKLEKYLKTYHGKMFIRNRLKSYLTG